MARKWLTAANETRLSDLTREFSDLRRRSQSRRPKPSPKLRQKVADAASVGIPVVAIARAASISRKTVVNWRDAKPALRELRLVVEGRDEPSVAASRQSPDRAIIHIGAARIELAVDAITSTLMQHLAAVGGAP